jgi:hypothetical protein
VTLNQLDQPLTEFEGYDLIGDIHGCYDSLVSLLDLLGYVQRDGVYQYRNQRQPRQVIFLGDVLDRGPKIRESMLLIQAMVEKGSALIVMGNHEYNALGYTTKGVEGDDTSYIRKHTAEHTRGLHETLEQYANHPVDWQNTLEWLYDWPLLLEFSHFRVIHACWDQLLVDQFLNEYPDARIDKNFLIKSADRTEFASRFMSRATRGASLFLPNNMTMKGSDGYIRRAFRVKYWVANPRYYSDVQFQPDPLPDNLVNQELTADQKAYIPFYGLDQRPLFIGHYWQSGEPAPLVDNIACLDYSAVKNGRLMAYRMNNEKTLSADNFIWVEGKEQLVL